MAGGKPLINRPSRKERNLVTTRRGEEATKKKSFSSLRKATRRDVVGSFSLLLAGWKNQKMGPRRTRKTPQVSYAKKKKIKKWNAAPDRMNRSAGPGATHLALTFPDWRTETLLTDRFGLVNAASLLRKRTGTASFGPGFYRLVYRLLFWAVHRTLFTFFLSGSRVSRSFF